MKKRILSKKPTGSPSATGGGQQRRDRRAIAADLQAALGMHRHGMLDLAEQVYREILQADPRQFDALQLLATLEGQRGDSAAAIDLFDRALKVKPDHAESLNNRGIALCDLGRAEEALQSYERALGINPAYPEALLNRGNALRDLERPDAALASYERALELRPDYPDAHLNRGNALCDLKRPADALESYARAIALQPGYPQAHYNRGNALRDLRRPLEALQSYDAALAIRPDFAEALFNRGNALRDLKRLEDALQSYERALAVRPGYAEALNNRGNTLHDLMRLDDALQSYDRALQIAPQYAHALFNRGNVLCDLGRLEQACDDYASALEVDPRYEFLYGTWLHTCMRLCDWRDVDARIFELTEKISRGERATPYFPVLALTDCLRLQRQAAEIWVAATCPANPALPAIPRRLRRDRIRVGYFSADFRNHPVSYLAAALFEQHDRTRFELTAFSYGADTQDEMRRRVAAAFDSFLDVRGQSDLEIATLARKLEIDIAVDLGGHTQGGRTGIFALRAAPLQVNYLGLPATMGADYIDYLIADATLIGDADRMHYAEKSVRLPNYQPNDRARRIAEATPQREAAGLPREGFVFCCFNNSYKITPQVFDCWMRILGRVAGSVLWLSGADAPTQGNLRIEAARRGIDASRLVFADRVAEMADHLARLRLGDLFLDTHPYNAQATASDALWAGLPVLTCAGESFAGRVAASLLNAVDLPELVTQSPQGYEATAVELAADPDRLGRLRRRLADNRLVTPLFDIARTARSMESAYTQMYERHLNGMPPEHIDVRD